MRLITWYRGRGVRQCIRLSTEKDNDELIDTLKGEGEHEDLPGKGKVEGSNHQIPALSCWRRPR